MPGCPFPTVFCPLVFDGFIPAQLPVFARLSSFIHSWERPFPECSDFITETGHVRYNMAKLTRETYTCACEFKRFSMDLITGRSWTHRQRAMMCVLLNGQSKTSRTFTLILLESDFIRSFFIIHWLIIFKCSSLFPQFCYLTGEGLLSCKSRVCLTLL